MPLGQRLNTSFSLGEFYTIAPSECEQCMKVWEKENEGKEGRKRREGKSQGNGRKK